MRVYFDACCWQRPFDNREQLRVAAESEVMIGMLSLFEAGQLLFVSSDVLELEISCCPDVERREAIQAILAGIGETVSVDDIIHQRAKTFEAFGVKATDALHLSSAESGRADIFCTCDDRLLRKARSLQDLSIRVLSLLELADEALP